MSIDVQRIGDEIRELRQQKQYTLATLADVVGLSARTIGAIERGEEKYRVDSETAAELLRNLAAIPPCQTIAIGKKIREIRTDKNYTIAAAGKALGFAPNTVAAAEHGGRYHTTMASPHTMQQVLDGMRELPAKPKRHRTKAHHKTVNIPTRKYENALYCQGADCGVVIFRTVAEVPKKWVPHFHINVNGYCPKCACRYGFGDLVRQKTEEIRRGAER